MLFSKYNRYDYSCIDLRLLKRRRHSRQPWSLVLFHRLKKVYNGFWRANLTFSPFSSPDHLADRLIWAAGLIVWVIAMLK